MTTSDQEDYQWISRCFELAGRGIGAVSPNPPVGAVLVHDNRIIGEGYHPYFGGPHAEVETIRSVAEKNRQLIPDSILYVSLEPCCVYGKTPPCTDLIIREGIRDVRLSTLDPNPKIAGRGMDLLKSHGIQVTNGIAEEEGRELIRMFRKNILFQKPYVLLKWAQSSTLFIGRKDHRVQISHPYTSVWSHNLRSSVDAILVGARTVKIDNPKLTTRDAPGRSPQRVVYDPNGTLTNEYQVFNNDQCRVFYFSLTENPDLKSDHIIKIKLDNESPHPDQILDQLFSYQIGILLVEGGSHLLGEFIRENLWDEAWIIQTKHPLDDGIKAPVLKGKLIQKIESATDVIIGMTNETNN